MLDNNIQKVDTFHRRNLTAHMLVQTQLHHQYEPVQVSVLDWGDTSLVKPTTAISVVANQCKHRTVTGSLH